eukprot:320518-Pyramimonas_sp.AAC.1
MRQLGRDDRKERGRAHTRAARHVRRVTPVNMRANLPNPVTNLLHELLSLLHAHPILHRRTRKLASKLRPDVGVE